MSRTEVGKRKIINTVRNPNLDVLDILEFESCDLKDEFWDLKVGREEMEARRDRNKHFIVQIFRTNGFERINFCSDKGKNVARAYSDATTPLLQTTSSKSEYEKVMYIDADTGKGTTTTCMDGSFCMTNKDAQNDQEDGRLCLDQSSFEMPASKPLVQGTNSYNNGKEKRRARTSPEAISTSLLGPRDKKFKEAS
ncbi:hypothetical protein T459_34686 [Capsicum annuum]|uniref:Uncharacterized protein n=1 Tax=Capsicum annuum TaxID=4072 RepID=A0A2G2XVE2_CAPAN|nr:hypothetical protein FXO37_04318 [Capsicum annuum]PHT61465.1 hypothetical protein T459_34686 [Capsicum annuum]